jgi:hypothetical protein
MNAYRGGVLHPSPAAKSMTASVRRGGSTSAELIAEALARRYVHLLAVNLGHDVFAETVEVATERRLRESTVRGLQLAELLHERFPFVVVETETLHYELADELVGEVRADPAEAFLTE